MAIFYPMIENLLFDPSEYDIFHLWFDVNRAKMEKLIGIDWKSLKDLWK